MSMLDAFFNSRGFKGAKCKTLLKLTIPRIKLLRNRREIQLKQMRRDIAKLLENGQEATARIRVEHIIREENMMAAQEILELLCELIAVRLPIIETQRECPLDLKEAISSICFAAPRCSDLPELQQVQMMFAAKYGREFVAAATELMPDCGVNRQIIELLSVRAPVMEAKMKLLKEIAEEHEVDWDPAESDAEFHQPHEDLLNGPSHIIDGSALPLPKEKHDDSISSGHTQEHGEEDTDTGLESLNLPEVPKASVQPTPGNPSVPDFSPHVVKFPPHLSDYSLNESKSSDNLGDEFINPMSENKQFQFVPFVASPPPPPFTLPSDESEPTSVHHHDQTPPFVASPPPPFSLPSDESEPIFVTSHATLSSKQTDPTPFIFHDPPSLSHSKSEANIDLQDVLAAAQAAADSADRAAAAARAAASLAHVRISKLIEKKNEDKASENSAGNPTFDQVNVFDHTDHVPCYEDSGDLHKVEGGSPDTVQFCHQPQRYVSLEEDPYFSYPNLFTRQESGIEPGGHSSDERS